MEVQHQPGKKQRCHMVSIEEALKLCRCGEENREECPYNGNSEYFKQLVEDGRITSETSGFQPCGNYMGTSDICRSPISNFCRENLCFVHCRDCSILGATQRSESSSSDDEELIELTFLSAWRPSERRSERKSERSESDRRSQAEQLPMQRQGKATKRR